MLYEFSLPTKADAVPTGPDWLHEVKYDGYRMMLIRDQDRVRLISRGGYDLTRHFPLIVDAALKLRQQHFLVGREVNADEALLYRLMRASAGLNLLVEEEGARFRLRATSTRSGRGAPGQRFEAYERNVSRIVARRLGGVEGPRLAGPAASWASNSEAS